MSDFDFSNAFEVHPFDYKGQKIYLRECPAGEFMNNRIDVLDKPKGGIEYWLIDKKTKERLFRVRKDHVADEGQIVTAVEPGSQVNTERAAEVQYSNAAKSICTADGELIFKNGQDVKDKVPAMLFEKVIGWMESINSSKKADDEGNSTG